jgi:DNA-binding transcriptional regulator YiaG
MSVLSELIRRGGPRVQVRTGTVRRSSSGERIKVVLAPPKGGPLGNTIEVFRVLVEAGLSVRAAKDVSDRLRDRAPVFVDAPSVENFARFKARIEQEGIAVQRLADAPGELDVKALREKLQLSQSEFAGLFRFGLDSVQNWEQGRTRPDRSAATLLDMIRRDPNAVMALLVEP